MAVNNIWVFAQVANGAPTTGTLELLSKARTLGTVSAFVGGDASDVAAVLGEYGAGAGVGATVPPSRLAGTASWMRLVMARFRFAMMFRNCSRVWPANLGLNVISSPMVLTRRPL